MKLKEEIVERIYGYDLKHKCALKKELQKTLGRNAASVCNYLRENRENGELMKLNALQVIAARLQLTIEELTD